MHTNFYNHITKYFDLIENKKILILNDPYYSFSATKKNINIEKKIDKLNWVDGFYRKDIGYKVIK